MLPSKSLTKTGISHPCYHLEVDFLWATVTLKAWLGQSQKEILILLSIKLMSN